jgi:hypothetical protein
VVFAPLEGTPQILLAYHLKTLKLPTCLREYNKLVRQCASDAVDQGRYLLRLPELELIERERRMIERRIKDAKFPTVKSLDSFDFLALPSLNKMLVLELARRTTSSGARISSPSATAARARAISRSGSAWQPARRVDRLALSRRRLWSTNCSKRATKNGYCAFSVSSPATSC